MMRSMFHEEHIIAILQELEAGILKRPLPIYRQERLRPCRRPSASGPRAHKH